MVTQSGKQSDGIFDSIVARENTAAAAYATGSAKLVRTATRNVGKAS